MKLYCGIDLHANNSVVAVLDEGDSAVYEKRLPNDLSTIIDVLRPYQADLTGCVVESTYNWYWLVDGLMEAGFPVHLAHTGAMPVHGELLFIQPTMAWAVTLASHFYWVNTVDGTYDF